jgi:hypothetical protein
VFIFEWRKIEKRGKRKMSKKVDRGKVQESKYYLTPKTARYISSALYPLYSSRLSSHAILPVRVVPHHRHAG